MLPFQLNFLEGRSGKGNTKLFFPFTNLMTDRQKSPIQLDVFEISIMDVLQVIYAHIKII